MSTPTTLVTPAALTAEEAAVYLGLSRQTLANWRVRGLGPVYSRLGGTGRPRIVYLVEDLEDYRSRTWCLSSGFRLGLRAKVAVI